MSWPLVEIGKLVEKVNSWNPIKSGEGESFNYIDLSSVDKDKKVVRLEEVTSLLPSEAPSRARQLVKSDDVLVATVRPNLNGVAKVPNTLEGATASTGYCVLRAKKSELDSSYLYYWVQTSSFVSDMMSKATGANYPAVSDKVIKQSKIPLPPLEEQKRIAAILDKADAIRRKRQQVIQLADDFLRSVFLDMFGDPVGWDTNSMSVGWSVKAIEEIALLKRGYDLPKQNRIKGNFPIYAANGVTGTHNTYKVKGPGVITGRSGTIGKVIYSESDFWPLNTSLYVTNFHENNPKYIEWYLRFLNLERYVQGAGVPTLNRNLFLKELSAVPPKAEQDKFEMICKLVNQFTSKNLDFNNLELFNSLSQRAFAGEL